jgi:ribose 5-phosphate isomerase B
MAIGSDTAGNLTSEIATYLASKGIDIVRCGALKGTPVDYVDGAHEVAQAVASGECEQGLIFCNTGTGVSIIANKVAGVRAALCVEPYAAKIARLANNANVIILSIRMTGEPLAKDILDTWLETAPSKEPRRVNFHRKTDEIDDLYRKAR